MSSIHDLDTRVRTLLGARKGDWPAIAEASGVSHSWLSKFFNGHIENPGYQTLRNLHLALTKKRTKAEA